MRIALISCGRSDYSIYYPLMKAIQAEKMFELNIIAFGTHVSSFYGHTIDEFYKDGFEVNYKLESLILGDSQEAIATSMGLTTMKFAAIWAKEKYDLVMVLGDRFEMFAAISAVVPFNIPVAHLHGGETTLGAIDDRFRHAITAMSTYHFTSTEGHRQRVIAITNDDQHVYNVGALALDNIRQMELFDKDAFLEKYQIDLNKPTYLSTYHPETVSLDKNIAYIETLFEVFKSSSDKQIVITMPNADTMGSQIRKRILELSAGRTNVIPVENLGIKGYYSCMKYSELLIGNTSSGIIEAASFGKYVINLGDRQKGREAGDNVFHTEVKYETIMNVLETISKLPLRNSYNIYGTGETTSKIISILKELN
ncbi:UDP-N-acetylglucosamine 2-epimerase [Pedobacter caeni]|uniref:GDP/UDP-N,N'-diacetylbacillosamine 2-epimerase (Hydrolysing) n=1 Tax=Pedobacter caeni TaxID=288992 RepID=A0A1M5PQ81_9SPHI|nr:UDP-N-acetylglucosamine 2-epimerase [Pedobacter caeni]SHH03830.1 GDP/UDP-N,N'-diacetylbacillosamine 2-epimerase (hydrolysing) [Pedobacter caeni]